MPVKLVSGRVASLKNKFKKAINTFINSIWISIFTYTLCMALIVYHSEHPSVYNSQFMVSILLYHTLIYAYMTVCATKKIVYTIDKSKPSWGITYCTNSIEQSLDAAFSSSISKGVYSLALHTVKNTLSENRLMPTVYAYENSSSIPLCKCNISIDEVHLIARHNSSSGSSNDDAIIVDDDSSDDNDSDSDDTNDNPCSYISDAQYKIKVTSGSYCWYVWRTFANIKDLESNLANIHPLVNIPSLIPMSIARYRKASSEASSNSCGRLPTTNTSIENASQLVMQIQHEATAKSYSINGRIDVDRVSAEQILMVAWLQSIQKHSILSNDASVRKLFNMMEYNDIRPVAAAAAIERITPVKASNNSDDSVISSGSKTSNIASPASSASPSSTAATEVNELNGMKYSGNSIDSIRFLDQSSAARAMCVDCNYTHNFKVRGPTYLKDSKKIEAGLSLCKLITIDLIEVEKKYCSDRIDHIASKGIVKKRLDVLCGLVDDPFVFILNIQIPGDPPVSIVCYFAIPSSWRSSTDKAYIDLVDRFFDIPTAEEERRRLWKQSDDKPGFSDITWPKESEPGSFPLSFFPNKRFKLIPSVIGGPWVVQMAVKSTPVLLGTKVGQRYFKTDKYVEIDVHVGSSLIAAQIVGICRGYANQFSTNMGLVIQGEADDELPERLFASICLNKIDIDVRIKLDDHMTA